MASTKVLLGSAAMIALLPGALLAQAPAPAGGSAAQSQPSSEAPTAARDPADATAGAAEAPAGETGVGDIVVTANRRSENLQRVPISIAAFKGETLTKLGIQSTNDLPQITPGLSQTRTLVGVNAFLRGVGRPAPAIRPKCRSRPTWTGSICRTPPRLPSRSTTSSGSRC